MPSSARLPLGHQPPWGMLFLIAQSSAKRSMPIWPPDMIFKLVNGLQGGGVLRCCVALSYLVHELSGQRRAFSILRVSSGVH